MAFRSCHRALLLALAIVFSFWISFVFGGKQVQFNDWHYDYRVLSYGLNRPEKHDNLGKIPSQFVSSRGWPQRRMKLLDDMAYRWAINSQFLDSHILQNQQHQACARLTTLNDSDGQNSRMLKLVLSDIKSEPSFFITFDRLEEYTKKATWLRDRKWLHYWASWFGELEISASIFLVWRRNDDLDLRYATEIDCFARLEGLWIENSYSCSSTSEQDGIRQLDCQDNGWGWNGRRRGGRWLMDRLPMACATGIINSSSLIFLFIWREIW